MSDQPFFVFPGVPSLSAQPPRLTPGPRGMVLHLGFVGETALSLVRVITALPESERGPVSLGMALEALRYCGACLEAVAQDFGDRRVMYVESSGRNPRATILPARGVLHA